MSTTFQDLQKRRRDLERELATAVAVMEQKQKQLREIIEQAESEFGTSELAALAAIEKEERAKITAWEEEAERLLEGLE